MSDNIFWLRIWAISALTVSVLILSIGASVIYDSAKIAEAIKNGADPMKASCAIRGFNGGGAGSAVCAQVAAKGVNQ